MKKKGVHLTVSKKIILLLQASYKYCKILCKDFLFKAKSCAVHYSYDIHGNVKTLLQDNPSLATVSPSQQYKKIDYTYDLISGNVNTVNYQQGQPDAFSHHYEYDADNRITNVYTSKYPSAKWTGIQSDPIWDQDQKLFYYLHGPLARVELGDEKVQGLDYAYTLQGWIKGVNSDALLPGRDIGKDADNSTSNLNKYLARDAFGYSLGYYSGDYKPIGNFTASNSFTASITSSALMADRNDLFNGNISHMVTAITNPTNNTTMTQGTAYKYDQLNRIKRMRAHRNLDYANNLWPAASGDDGSYAEDYTYNANGSIQSLKRNGLASINGGLMDDLTYKYETVANGYTTNTNKLRQIQDAVASTTYTDDVDMQVQNNYVYDEIGNLKADQFECIQNIEWTVYGKVKKLTRTPGCTTEGTAMPDLEFQYNANGNVIAKIVKPAGQLTNPNAWITTYYTHDASGNIMATYEKQYNQQTQMASFKLIARELYGNRHLGTDKSEIELIGAIPQGNTFTRTLGKKNFFLSDQRGNNNVTVSDRKIAIEDLPNNPGTIAYFEADIVRAVDYFPFGREQNGRIFNRDESEFGYNGKPNVKEWSARLGGAQLYGARIKFGEGFLSEDPLQRTYPSLSPYSYAANSPLMFIDGDGRVIVDPKSNQPVVKVEGVWKTIDGTDANGKVTYGDVSKEFVKNTQPVLDKLTATKTGTKIYDQLQSISTLVTIDLSDKDNKQGLKEKKSNSEWHATQEEATNDDGLYKAVTITPSLGNIDKMAKESGVDVEEKFLQVMSVETNHIGTKEQIAKEKSYDKTFDTPEKFADVYNSILNQAIRVGKEFRVETGKSVTESSNIPIIAPQGKDIGKKLTLESDNK